MKIVMLIGLMVFVFGTFATDVLQDRRLDALEEVMHLTTCAVAAQSIRSAWDRGEHVPTIFLTEYEQLCGEAPSRPGRGV